MICPKCGFDAPAGPDCPACGVIMDKFARRAFNPDRGAAPQFAPPVTPRGHRAPVAKRKPIGKGLVLAVIFIIVATGGMFAWDAIRLKMSGQEIRKAMQAALQPKNFRRAMLTGDVLYEQLKREFLGRKLKVPLDRAFLRIEGRNSAAGEVIHLSVELLIPRKIAGLINYPLYERVEGSFPSSWLPNGYQQFTTDEKTTIAQDLLKRQKGGGEPR